MAAKRHAEPLLPGRSLMRSGTLRQQSIWQETRGWGLFRTGRLRHSQCLVPVRTIFVTTGGRRHLL